MTFDVIVFSQKELFNALNSGNKRVALCDNVFTLPLIPNISYMAIGTADISINTSKEEFERMNISCIGFVPCFTLEYSDKIPILYTSSVSSYISSYFMSSYFLTSYSTSYLTSYKTSYMYEYEYETGSFTSSYFSSYSSSFQSNIPAFFSFLNMRNKTIGKAWENAETENKVRENKVILVNGYGINLI